MPRPEGPRVAYAQTLAHEMASILKMHHKATHREGLCAACKHLVDGIKSMTNDECDDFTRQLRMEMTADENDGTIPFRRRE